MFPQNDSFSKAARTALRVAGVRRPGRLASADPRGFTLVEALLAILVLGLVAVPTSAALFSLSQGALTRVTDQTVADLMQDKLEDICALRFKDVTLSDPPGSASALSDTVTVNDVSMARTVIVDLEDGDNDGVLDEDLKRVTIRIQDQDLVTLVVDL